MPKPRYETTYAAVAAMEKKNPGIALKVNLTQRGQVHAVAQTQEAARIVHQEQGFTFLDPNSKTTRVIVVGYPLQFELDPIRQRPEVTSATRCTTRTKLPTTKVECVYQGPVPKWLNLGIYGSYPHRALHPGTTQMLQVPEVWPPYKGVHRNGNLWSMQQQKPRLRSLHAPIEKQRESQLSFSQLPPSAPCLE